MTDPSTAPARRRRLTPRPIDIYTAKWLASTLDPGRLVHYETEAETNFGVSAEYDRLVLAFNEIASLVQEVEQRSDEIFERHELIDHGFRAGVYSGYFPGLDKHASEDTPKD